MRPHKGIKIHVTDRRAPHSFPAVYKLRAGDGYTAPEYDASVSQVNIHCRAVVYLFQFSSVLSMCPHKGVKSTLQADVLRIHFQLCTNWGNRQAGENLLYSRPIGRTRARAVAWSHRIKPRPNVCQADVLTITPQAPPIGGATDTKIAPSFVLTR